MESRHGEGLFYFISFTCMTRRPVKGGSFKSESCLLFSARGVFEIRRCPSSTSLESSGISVDTSRHLSLKNIGLLVEDGWSFGVSSVLLSSKLQAAVSRILPATSLEEGVGNEARGLAHAFRT